jgi:drug/metabolite transporter (DMT)-like permease
MRECKGIFCGISWMVAAQILFVVSWAAIKFLGTRLPLFEIVFFRGFISFIIIIFITLWKEKTLKGTNYAALFFRSFFGFLAMVLAFYAMIKVDIGNASVLFNTLPIWVALLATPILGEAFSLRKLILIVIAFVGIAIILRPDQDILSGAAIYALIAGFLGALAMLFVRKMATSDSSLTITLYFTAFTTACSAPFAMTKFVPPTLPEWGWLLMIGVALTGAQVFMAHAYKFGYASTIAPFSYVSVIGAYVVGLWFFGELPDIWSAVGAAIIIFSGIGIMFSKPTTTTREEIRSAKVT